MGKKCNMCISVTEKTTGLGSVSPMVFYGYEDNRAGSPTEASDALVDSE